MNALEREGVVDRMLLVFGFLAWGIAAPLRADALLVSRHAYDEAGRQAVVYHPDGNQTQTEYDGLGRVLMTTENSEELWNPNGEAIDLANIRQTAYRYDDKGRLIAMAALGMDMLNFQERPWSSIDWENGGHRETAPLQITSFVYGAEVVDRNATVISQHNGWIKEVHYPNPSTGAPSSTPSLTYQYYSDGSVASREDEKHNRFVYHYDEQGRLAQTDVTGSRWYAAGANQRYNPPPQIIKITYTYTADGLPELVTAYGEGETILSQNKFEYDGLRHLRKEWQSHGGAVTGSTPVIQYDWDASPKDTSSSGYDRLVGMTYPARPESGARSLGFNYGTAGSVDSALNRIVQITEGAALATYTYMGTSRRVGVSLGNGIEQTFINDGACTGLDRFGRVTDLHFKDGANTVHQYQYAYDRSGNRIRAQVTQATINGTAHNNDRSYLYSYDDLQRLISAQMGKLVYDTEEQQYVIESGQDVDLYRSLTWNLDLLGNWAGPSSSPNLIGLRRQDDTNHDGMIDVTTNIDHTTDAFNKITAVKTNGQNVAHLNDPAGNLIFDGQYVYQYDAWNRQVEVNRVGTLTIDDFTADGKINPTGGHQIGDLVMRFVHDGVGRLIMAQKPVSGSPPDPTYKTEHYYYDGVRRVQEVDDNATPASGADDLTQHEYVYGPSYVDEFVLESQKTVSGQQPFYILQDANYNVMALLDASGAVVEQYQWEPYGLLAAKDTDTSGTIPHSHIGHQGLFFYRLDDTVGPPLSSDAVGLYCNINRWYDPALARFTSRDPHQTAQLVIGTMAMNGRNIAILAAAFDATGHFGDGMNLYAYEGSNPLCRRDPSGLLLGLGNLGGGVTYKAYMEASAAGAAAGAFGYFVASVLEGASLWNAGIEAICFGVTSFAVLGTGGELHFLMGESLLARAATTAAARTVAVGSSAITVTNELIRSAMQRGWLRFGQDYVSRMRVQESINRFLAGETPQPIQVVIGRNGDWIADGHHRYIAALILDVPIKWVYVTRLGSPVPWDLVQIIP